MTALDTVLAKIPAKRSGKEYAARCPAHDDKKASLSIGQGDKGVVLKCHAGCPVEAILASAGLAAADLFDTVEPERRTVAEYVYTDEDGAPLYQVVRYDPKDFRQQAWNGKTWVWGMKSVQRRVPYRLPELIAAVRDSEPIWIVEGEKDANRLAQDGHAATCNVGGAGKWSAEHAHYFADANITIVADDDPPGHDHARDVERKLGDKPRSVRILISPYAKDVSAHLAAGHTLDELDELEPLEKPEPHVDLVPAGARRILTLKDVAAMTRQEPSWLATYMQVAADEIMAPEEFHLAAGLAALSAAIGRGLYFRLGGRRRYLHLWMLLLARAGAGKSTTSDFAADLVRALRSDDAILPRRWSPEAFYDALAACGDGFWDIGEISGFLRLAGRDYMSGTREDMCDLWDSKSTQRKLRKETIRVDRPALTAVATGRISDFEVAGGRQDFVGGFMSRFLLFASDDAPIYKGLDNAEDSDAGHLSTGAQNRLLVELRQIGALRSDKELPIKISDEARREWEAADQQWINDTEKVEEMLHGWARRRGIQAMKLAGLYAASRTGRGMIDIDDIVWAIMVVDSCFETVSRIALDDVGLERDDLRRRNIFERARSIAAQHGGIVSRRDIMRAFQTKIRSTREFDDLVNVWEASGAIELGRLRPAGRGRPATAIRFPDLCPTTPDTWENA